MLSGSVILEIGLGLAYVYLLFALFCTAIHEAIAQVFSLRTANLIVGLRLLLDGERVTPRSKNFDSGMASQLLKHGLISASAAKRHVGFARKEVNAPAYIAPRNFALALLEVLHKLGPNSALPMTLHSIRDTINAMPAGKLRDALVALLNESGNDIEKFRAGIDRWFTESMDRMGGWYKRNAQYLSAIIAAVLVITLNVDTIEIVRILHRDAPARAVLIAAAESAARDKDPARAGQSLEEIKAELKAMPLPIGWGDMTLPEPHERLPALLRKLVGLTLSAFAVSLGAPFWFDVLNKIMSLRAAGKKPAAG